jgi:hypothetical protein
MNDIETAFKNFTRPIHFAKFRCALLRNNRAVLHSTMTAKARLGFNQITTQEVMKNTLIVVTDLGGFKAFQLDNDPSHSTPKLEVLKQFDIAGARGHLVEKVSDLSGRFPRGAGTAKANGAMSDGERHNIELEHRKRCVRRLAGEINSIMRDPKIERCLFAASREISNPLLEELEPRVRAKIELNVTSDLMKVNKSELLGHFKAATRPSASA